MVGFCVSKLFWIFVIETSFLFQYNFLYLWFTFTHIWDFQFYWYSAFFSLLICYIFSVYHGWSSEVIFLDFSGLFHYIYLLAMSGDYVLDHVCFQNLFVSASLHIKKKSFKTSNLLSGISRTITHLFSLTQLLLLSQIGSATRILWTLGIQFLPNTKSLSTLRQWPW